MKFIDWIWGAACAGVGVFEFARGEPLDGFVCVGVGVVLTVLLAWLHAADKPKEKDSILALPSPKRTGGTMPPPPPSAPDTVNVMLSKGSEPVPIPGERYTFDDPHELGSRSATCTYCRNWKEHHSE